MHRKIKKNLAPAKVHQPSEVGQHVNWACARQRLARLGKLRVGDERPLLWAAKGVASLSLLRWFNLKTKNRGSEVVGAPLIRTPDCSPSHFASSLAGCHAEVSKNDADPGGSLRYPHPNGRNRYHVNRPNVCDPN